jgi:hypothetical protein
MKIADIFYPFIISDRIDQVHAASPWQEKYMADAFIYDPLNDII